MPIALVSLCEVRACVSLTCDFLKVRALACVGRVCVLARVRVLAWARVRVRVCAGSKCSARPWRYHPSSGRSQRLGPAARQG